MRRTCDAPVFGVSQFAGTAVVCGDDGFVEVIASAGCSTLASASGARRQRALPFASVVKATSPPP
eukprot:1938354-Pleurochrysis_carterae.AAC.1